MTKSDITTDENLASLIPISLLSVKIHNFPIFFPETARNRWTKPLLLSWCSHALSLPSLPLGLQQPFCVTLNQGKCVTLSDMPLKSPNFLSSPCQRSFKYLHLLSCSSLDSYFKPYFKINQWLKRLEYWAENLDPNSNGLSLRVMPPGVGVHCSSLNHWDGKTSKVTSLM